MLPIFPFQQRSRSVLGHSLADEQPPASGPITSKRARNMLHAGLRQIASTSTHDHQPPPPVSAGASARALQVPPSAAAHGVCPGPETAASAAAAAAQPAARDAAMDVVDQCDDVCDDGAVAVEARPIPVQMSALFAGIVPHMCTTAATSTYDTVTGQRQPLMPLAHDVDFAAEMGHVPDNTKPLDMPRFALPERSVAASGAA